MGPEGVSSDPNTPMSPLGPPPKRSFFKAETVEVPEIRSVFFPEVFVFLHESAVVIKQAGGRVRLGPRQARLLYNWLYHVLPEGLPGDRVTAADLRKEESWGHEAEAIWKYQAEG